MRDINNNQDILDSRDVIARRDELANARDIVVEDFECTCADDDGEPRTPDTVTCGTCGSTWCDRCRPTHGPRCHKEADHISEDDAEELAALEAFIAEGSDEWRHGVALVRETYFEDYAQELADDLGAIPKDARWPLTCIDWEHAARELRYDYTGADFDGVTYYYQG